MTTRCRLMIAAVLASVVILTMMFATVAADRPDLPPDLPTRHQPVTVPVTAVTTDVSDFSGPTVPAAYADVLAGSVLMSSERIRCMTVRYSTSSGSKTMKMRVKWCFNVTSPPYLIRGYTLYQASGSGHHWPVTIDHRSHNHTGGGKNQQHVKSTGKVRWRIPDDEGNCALKEVLQIKTDQRSNGQSYKWGKYWAENC